MVVSANTLQIFTTVPCLKFSTAHCTITGTITPADYIAIFNGTSLLSFNATYQADFQVSPDIIRYHWENSPNKCSDGTMNEDCSLNGSNTT